LGNAKQFSLDLSSWADKLEKEAVPKFVRTVATDLLRKVTMKSPVDTGRFRANWMVGIGAADESIFEVEGKISEETATRISMERGLAVITTYNSPDKNVHISNNLPYANELEKGHSMRAPLGVVEISVIEVEMNLSGDRSVRGDKIS